MLRKIINFQRYTVPFIFLLAVSGCGDSGNGASWKLLREAALKEKSEYKRDVSTKDLEKTFLNYFNAMENIVSLCDQYPAIQRVGADGSISYHGRPAELDIRALDPIVSSMRSTLSTIGASSLRCDRRGGVDGHPLSNVSFVMYAVGLSVSGQIKTIGYFTDWERQHSPLRDRGFQKQGFKPLNKPGWYIYESKD